MKKKCTKCNRKIDPRNKSKLCIICYRQYRRQIAKKNQDNHCIDCNKKIDFRSTRCHKCYLKFNIGMKNSNFKGSIAVTNKKYYCKDCDKKVWYGSTRCHSCAQKLKWQTKEYRVNTVRASIKGLLIKPNKPEKCLNKLLNKLFLKEYKFVGDGKLIVGGFCPDFVNINGQKKLIELYGDYWHKRPEVLKRDKRRKIAYKKYGYKTLIIWEHELKDLNKVKNKIKEFHFDSF